MMSAFFHQRRELLLFLVGVMVVGFLASGSHAADKPKTIAEIALYRGPDREGLLIEGAKAEGKLVFYTSNTWMRRVAESFGKKYPFVEVTVWRSGTKKMLKRVTEEYASQRFLVDVIEGSYEGVAILNKNRLMQEYYTPESAHYNQEVKLQGKQGVYYLANREIYISLGFNTGLIPPDEAPKRIEDLLQEKWKGKMSIAGTSTGVRWVGVLLDTKGREFLEKMSQQNVKVQNISGAALAGLVVSGEVPLSPTIYDSNIFTAKKKGAPVEWRPLEPVIASVGYSGLPVKAPHPHAAVLFLDYIHSKAGQEVAMQGGLGSPREDMAPPERQFKKTYMEARYSIDGLEKNFDQWEKLMRRLFIAR